MTINVSPIELEWKPAFIDHVDVDAYVASTAIGEYKIMLMLAGTWKIYPMFYPNAPFEEKVHHPDLESAKEACQEDFNERILACLKMDDE